MNEYAAFLESKAPEIAASGIDAGEIHPVLYDFQAAIVRWAVRRGRAAIFADCGLGKTFMQLEWLRQLDQDVSLIVSPLAVTTQTIEEAQNLGMDVRYVTEPPDSPGVYITNYQRLKNFIGSDIGAIVLDESSILKSVGGKIRTMILDEFKSIPFRLCCTATPAPNDLTELGNHVDFLGIMSNKEMSATFFVKDSDSMNWRLKGYAADAFYKWMASWSSYIRHPSDIGYDQPGFDLPPLNIHDVQVPVKTTRPGQLFPGVDPGIQGRHAARKLSEDDRIDRAVAMIEDSEEQWIVWCGLNSEGQKLHKRLNGQSVLVEGATSDENKLARSAEWISGERRVMVSKPSIYGYGMNFQHCHNVLFLGMGDSYEQYYQAIRRCWRFGQSSPVNAHIVTSDAESCVVDNVRRKENQATKSAREVVKHMSEFEKIAIEESSKESDEYNTDETTGKNWRMICGDSTTELSKVESDSVGLSVFSPPFVSLYTYSNSARDMGNSKDEAEFFEHFQYIIRELLRTTKPGRNCCVHVAQIAAMLVRDGYIGMKDFRAEVVKQFRNEGWIYHGECVIDKDPQVQAIRTHSKGLLFVQLKKDSSWLRPAMADYILVFRKPGENTEPISPDISHEEWIEWARPIWYGIRESETLNYREARTDKDERHICPLQLGTIERCIRLWSNPGDLVLSPFAGIGSEGYQAVRFGRRFVGVELKPEYYRLAIKNLNAASSMNKSLFDD